MRHIFSLIMGAAGYYSYAQWQHAGHDHAFIVMNIYIAAFCITMFLDMKKDLKIAPIRTKKDIEAENTENQR